MGESWQVVYFQEAQTALRDILTDAATRDKELARRIREALQTADQRFHTDPRTFGEARFVLQHLRLEVRVAVVLPLCFSFAVHETLSVVFVRDCRLLIPPRT